MSLNNAIHFENDGYVFKSLGDIDNDPDDLLNTGPSLNLEDEAEDRRTQSKTLHNLDENIASPVHHKTNTYSLPELEGLDFKRPSMPKQSSVKEKIFQVQTNKYVFNYTRQDFSKGVDEYAKEEVEQALKNNYRKNSDGTIEMVNKYHLKRQKQVLGFLIKQFGSALFTGKSIMNVSLPVTIFEPQSHLERQARGLMYAPHFLGKGGQIKDVYAQFKLAVAHFISSLHLGTNPQKPFNPILGETFQGIIGGCPVYAEQISHHPPASALLMTGKNFRVEGTTEFNAAVSMNSVKSCKVGYVKVIYPNTNSVIYAQYPPGFMSGTAIGKRTFQFCDQFYIFDLKNNFYAEIDFNQNEGSLFKKKSKLSKDHFRGTIWSVNNRFVEKLRQATIRNNELAEMRFKEKDHASSKLDTIEGSWLEYLCIGNETYWTFDHLSPYKLQYFDNPLPSDSNYRLDVLYLRTEDETKSQENKTMLEESQRRDRRLREQGKAKSKK